MDLSFVVESEFKESLSDLTFNSKTIINHLTILCQESLQYASIITSVLEDHIYNVIQILDYFNNGYYNRHHHYISYLHYI